MVVFPVLESEIKIEIDMKEGIRFRRVKDADGLTLFSALSLDTRVFLASGF